MDRLARDLDLARQELTPQWSAERSARLFAGARAFGPRRARRRAALGTLGVLAAAAVLLVGLRRGAPDPSARAAGARAAGGKAQAALASDKVHSGHTLRLADGSRTELVGEHSELEVLDNTRDRIALRLVSGRAHFEAVHDPMRSFVVEAQPYRVEVIGTIFDVERDAREVAVSVGRGKVRVYGPQGAEDLVAGQIKHFARSAASEMPAAAAAAPAPFEEESPAGDEDTAAELSAERAERARRHAHATNARHGGAAASWRSLSQSGQYDAAFESLRRSSPVEDDPAALMDAADAARLSGHAQDAVQYLARVVRSHQHSPIAPLAAFTLGRVYLDRLGQPDRAARAFGTARRLAPTGSLAQDALAREVEALSKGGNARLAYARAQEYLRLYPSGRRLRAVQLYGGLD